MPLGSSLSRSGRERILPGSREFVAEDGPLLGHLVRTRIVADDVDAYAAAASGSWETREAVIANSQTFLTYLTPQLLSPGDLGPLMESSTVPDAVKREVLSRLGEFAVGADVAGLKQAAEYAKTADAGLPHEALILLASEGVSGPLIVDVLEPTLATVGAAEIETLLSTLGGKYAELTKRAWGPVKLPATPSHRVLAERLDALGLVSSVSSKTKNGQFKVNRKRT